MWQRQRALQDVESAVWQGMSAPVGYSLLQVMIMIIIVITIKTIMTIISIIR